MYPHFCKNRIGKYSLIISKKEAIILTKAQAKKLAIKIKLELNY